LHQQRARFCRSLDLDAPLAHPLASSPPGRSTIADSSRVNLVELDDLVEPID